MSAHLAAALVAHAEATPDAPAVVSEHGPVTYRALDEAANRAAHLLAAAGVVRGDRVVLWGPKSPLIVAIMQGALRLGAAYVPVAASNPPSRLARIATDCAATVVVAADPDVVPDDVDATVVGLSAVRDPAGDASPVWADADPDDLAYLLYTSGSTGDPKGVAISHGNALAFITWAADELGARSEDRFANHAPFNFDLSVLDLYVALHAGAAVHLVPEVLAYSPPALVDWVAEQGITVWYSVPSALTLMLREGGLLERDLPDLRAVLFAGEPFPISGVRQLRVHLPHARLLNLYGPTETNVCTWHEVTDLDLTRDRPVPIGRPCSGDQVLAVDGAGRAVAPGDEGELVVTGPTVALGYWGRGPMEVPYRTGDLVAVRPDGSFDYRGRRDHQIKIQGHRVELGEVEAALVRHPAVHDAAVTVAGAGVEATLDAYIVPEGDPPSLIDLKAHCAGLLPSYMVVDNVHPCPELPRTDNGKLDRRSLPDLVATTGGQA